MINDLRIPSLYAINQASSGSVDNGHLDAGWCVYSSCTNDNFVLEKHGNNVTPFASPLST